MQYLIRSLKYFVFIVICFGIVVVALFYTTVHSPELTVFDLFKEGSGLKIFLFFVGVSAIYPLFGFAKKEIYTNNNFAEHKESIIAILKEYNYYVYSESATSITFRHRKFLIRLLRTFEDKITIDYSGNPVVVEGLRKDVYRFSRFIERAVMQDSQE